MVTVSTRRYFSELRAALCVDDESSIDWEDIEHAFAVPAASKEYLSTVRRTLDSVVILLLDEMPALGGGGGVQILYCIWWYLRWTERNVLIIMIR